jgi:hypothetical protein
LQGFRPILTARLERRRCVRLPAARNQREATTMDDDDAGNRPPGMPDDFPWRPMTRETLEADLIAIRNAAHSTLGALAVDLIRSTPPEDLDDREDTALIEDQRAVWHTAEIALAILMDRYVPKREAMFDVFALVRRYPASEAELERDRRERFVNDDDDAPDEMPAGVPAPDPALVRRELPFFVEGAAHLQRTYALVLRGADPALRDQIADHLDKVADLLDELRNASRENGE